MMIGSCMLYMRAAWVHSLKEKRMVVKPIVAKVQNKFNVSIAEVSDQDRHQNIVLGFACVSNERVHVEKIMETVIGFIENNTDAEIVDIVTEIL